MWGPATAATAFRYYSTYRDGGKGWTIEIPELDFPGAQGRTNRAIGGAVSVKELDNAARDLATVWLDVDAAAVAVAVRIVIPDEVQHLWNDGAAAAALGVSRQQSGCSRPPE